MSGAEDTVPWKPHVLHNNMCWTKLLRSIALVDCVSKHVFLHSKAVVGMKLGESLHKHLAKDGLPGKFSRAGVPTS